MTPEALLENKTPILYRIHRFHRSPWWFSNDRTGRFDLSEEWGTCYFGLDDESCFIEVFRSTVIAQEEVDARLISALSLPSDLLLADCTDPRSRAFGLTAEIHASPDYRMTQAWADALSGPVSTGSSTSYATIPASSPSGPPSVSRSGLT